VKITQHVCNDNGQIDSCVSEEVLSLRKLLESIDGFSRGSKTASQVIKEALDPVFQTAGWDRKHLVSRKFPVQEVPAANYYIDWQKKFPCRHEDMSHVLSFEYCFDNRQAIGTNLLKLATAEKQVGAQYNHMGIILTGTKQALKVLGWDGGVATSEEYWNAVEHGYRQSLRLPLIILSINLN